MPYDMRAFDSGDGGITWRKWNHQSNYLQIKKM